ncbi:MAG: hypothetical protein GY934_13415 [Gammaproteobacteria bacterium]|nr:hypothetical protein [Gammaproteobacteria bacterium]
MSLPTKQSLKAILLSLATETRTKTALVRLAASGYYQGQADESFIEIRQRIDECYNELEDQGKL